MYLKTASKEYTRVRNLKSTPKKLWHVDQNLFVETFQGLPLGKGVPLTYLIAPLEELVSTNGGESFITQRVTPIEANFLGKKGFVAKTEGGIKRWKRKK